MKSGKALLGLFAGAIVVSAVLLGRQADTPKGEPLAERMADAARKLLDGLRPAQREQAAFAYDDPARLQWHYYPTTPWPRKGAVLINLNAQEKELFHALLRTGLSDSGYKTAVAVMELEAILRDIENTDWARKYRNPELYHVLVFGTPGPKGKWGWRVEGHHLVVSYTVEDGKIIGSTPLVVGANPGEVFAGPHKGLRILAKEEDHARRLLTSLDEKARARATLSQQGPFDVLTEVKALPRRLPLEGLPFNEMTEKQKTLLKELLTLHSNRFPEPIRERTMKEITDAGPERIHFAWMGPPEPKEPHYYRIQGPSFVVEFCNTQNRANHIHCVWRSYASDFGLPPQR